MYNIFSFIYSTPPETPTLPIETPIETPETKSKIKYSNVDAHLLIWDLHHLSYHELENKYRAKYITICNLLKADGYPIFHKDISTNIESKNIKIPQELQLM